MRSSWPRNIRSILVFSTLILVTLITGCRRSSSTETLEQKPPPSLEAFCDRIEEEKRSINKDVIWNVGEPEDPFPYVCLVFSDSGKVIGSGVLINKYTVITAAHCNDRGLNYVSFDGGRNYKKIKCSTSHPSYKKGGSKKRPFADICILILESPVKNIRHVELNMEPLSSQKDRGKEMIAVGFGRGIKSYTKNSSCWYYGTMEGEDSLLWVSLETRAEPGDSGGAVLLLPEDSKPLLCGVISNWTQYKKGEILHSEAVRIDLYVDWIKDNWKNE
jgi:hypothetical protein